MIIVIIMIIMIIAIMVIMRIIIIHSRCNAPLTPAVSDVSLCMWGRREEKHKRINEKVITAVQKTYLLWQERTVDLYRKPLVWHMDGLLCVDISVWDHAQRVLGCGGGQQDHCWGHCVIVDAATGALFVAHVYAMPSTSPSFCCRRLSILSIPSICGWE